MRVIPPQSITSILASTIAEPCTTDVMSVPLYEPRVDPRITITRAGTATRVNSVGLIESVAANTGRIDYDPLTKTVKGLLVEESRINLCDYSAYNIGTWNNFFTSTATITTGIDDPMGGTGAINFTTNGTGTALLRVTIPGFTPTGTDIYTISFYCRWKNGSGPLGALYADLADSTPSSNYGSQLELGVWKRVSFSGTPGAVSKTFIDIFNNSSILISLDFWGVQVEQGGFPTSLIITTGSVTTRNADVLVMSGTNFSDWYNQSEGTFRIEAGTLYPTNPYSQVFISMDDGTVNERSYIGKKYDSTAVSEFGVSDGGVGQAFMLSTPTSMSNARYAAAYKVNDFGFSADGSPTTTDTLGTIPTPTILRIGYLVGGGTYLNGYVRSITYWPTRLTNSQLTQVSGGTEMPSGAVLNISFLGSIREVEWISSAPYSINDRVIRTTTHKVYEALSTHSGRTALPENDGVYWFEVGPTNKWTLFDLYRNTSSIIPSGGFSTSIALGKRIDSIAVLGARITDITIEVTSVTGGGTVYGPTTFPLISRDVLDYYDYFFMDFTYKPSILIFDIPPLIDAVVTISSTASGSIASVILGTSEYIGYTQKGHKNDALNFSLITRDTYGNSTLVPRRSVPKTSQTIIVKKKDLANLLRLREVLNAAPAVWSGLDDNTEGYFEALLILGIYKNLSISIDYPEYVTCTLELEEL